MITNEEFDKVMELLDKGKSREEIREEIVVREDDMSFLEHGDTVKLSGGRISFGKFKNRDREHAISEARKKVEKLDLSKEEENVRLQEITNEWLVAFMIYRGKGYLRCEKVEETYEKMQDVSFDDGYKLGRAAEEFIQEVYEDLKKKSKTK